MEPSHFWDLLALRLCLPNITDKMQECILEGFDKLKQFYDRNQDDLAYTIGEENAEKILNDFLTPYISGCVHGCVKDSVFSMPSAYYCIMLKNRFDTYCTKLKSIISVLPEDKCLIMKELRQDIATEISTLCIQIDDWHMRTRTWNSYLKSKDLN